jgi:signal transduction histidine kinase
MKNARHRGDGGSDTIELYRPTSSLSVPCPTPMQEPELTRILEHALHAHIASRCHRAYRHDLRNGLQGIYGGFDALSRLLRLPTDAGKVERVTDMVRQAIAGHEKSLDRVLHALSPLEQTPEPADASLLLQGLTKFLTNDAAASRVTLRSAMPQPVMVQVRTNKLRLVLLSLMLDAIDAMQGGGELQLNCNVLEGAAVLELIDTRAGSPLEHPWQLDHTTSPAYRGWTLYVARQMILAESGHIECHAAPSGARRIRIALPAATSISA